MPVLRSRYAVHRARLRGVRRLFALAALLVSLFALALGVRLAVAWLQ